MTKIKKLHLFIVFFLIISLIKVLSTCKVVKNELYVKIIPERIYFAFMKHEAPKELLKEYKKIKNKRGRSITYICEGKDYIFCLNGNDILSIIKFKNDEIVFEKYIPEFSYKITGDYVLFSFNDELIRYADYFLIDMYVDGEYELSLIPPISTYIAEYNVVKYIGPKTISDTSKVEFKIDKLGRYGDWWFHNYSYKKPIHW